MKKKKGLPGRKRDPKSLRSSGTVLPPIRVSQEQKAKYEKAAATADKSLSAWLKDLADKNS